jgi:hypothetical protein
MGELGQVGDEPILAALVELVLAAAIGLPAVRLVSLAHRTPPPRGLVRRSFSGGSNGGWAGGAAGVWI